MNSTLIKTQQTALVYEKIELHFEKLCPIYAGFSIKLLNSTLKNDSCSASRANEQKRSQLHISRIPDAGMFFIQSSMRD